MTKVEAETRDTLKEASRVHTEWQTLSTQAKAIPEVRTPVQTRQSLNLKPAKNFWEMYVYTQYGHAWRHYVGGIT